MSEKDMREILAGEYEKAGLSHKANPVLLNNGVGDSRATEAALRAMQEVERRTIERCAKVAEAEPEFPGDPPPEYVAKMAAAGPVVTSRAAARATKCSIASAIRALQDAPSDDTPPAKEGV